MPTEFTETLSALKWTFEKRERKHGEAYYRARLEGISDILYYPTPNTLQFVGTAAVSAQTVEAFLAYARDEVKKGEGAGRWQ